MTDPATSEVPIHLNVPDVCVGVLPACMSIHQVYVLPTQARSECWIPWDWSYSVSASVHELLGIESRYSGKNR